MAIRTSRDGAGWVAVSLGALTLGAACSDTQAREDASIDVVAQDASLDVGDPGHAIVEVVAAFVNTCARRVDGTVLCWGNNLSGQLADGTHVDHSRPVVVAAVPDAKGLTAGSGFVCARRSGGAASCWGHDGSGELGDGRMDHSSCSLGDRSWDCSASPVEVPGLTDVVQLSAGFNHVCARRAPGTVSCWGHNTSGQLGDGLTVHVTCQYSHHAWDCSPRPVIVVGLADAVEIALGGDRSCARRADGTVVCWGENGSGELGDGRTDHASCEYFYRRQWDCSTVPVPVQGLTNVAGLAAGLSHTCARRADGTVACWGGNSAGQLGDGTRTDRTVPVDVAGLDDAVAIAVGAYHTCAVHQDGSVACWGANSYGQLGDGTLEAHSHPTIVPGVADAVAVTAGTYHTCALRASGEVLCWGANESGQLGDGTTDGRSTPVPVIGLE